VDGYSFGGGFEAGHLTDGIHQRLPVMRSGAAHQRSVDVEKNKIGQGFPIVARRVLEKTNIVRRRPVEWFL
jgi:hypothetical protein